MSQNHEHLSESLLPSKIRKGKITIAGNTNLKIYGLLSCKSGKQMKRENRIFFKNEKEATLLGYRPCAHCMPIKYKTWKLSLLRHKGTKQI
jgi:methylphosphotriester-DNA--protein-cysteine methyltransferase